MNESAVLRVDPTNVDQAQAWNGDEGDYWSANAEHFDRSVAAYHVPFMRAAAIATDEHVLDVGCGTGQTTREAARAAVRGSALGIDLSSRMVDLARELADAEGLTNARFEQVDAQIHDFHSSFDVAISRTGAMFFGDPVAAFANVGRTLPAGGRFVMLTWQPLAANEWLRELATALAAGRTVPVPPPDAPGPFALSEPDRVRHILTAAGFSGIEMQPLSGPMWFGEDADDAQRFVLGLMGWMLEGLDDEGLAGAIAALHTTLAAHETTEGVVFGSGTWTIEATW